MDEYTAKMPDRGAARFAAPRRNFRNGMLIGFDPEANATIATLLRRIRLTPQVFQEPYTAMQALFEDPGSWMACILNAEIFSEDMPLDRYLRILGHQGHLYGVILANMPDPQHLDGAIGSCDSLDAILCDVSDQLQLVEALAAILRRRGFLRGDAAATTVTARPEQDLAATPAPPTRRPIPIRTRTGKIALLRGAEAASDNARTGAEALLLPSVG